MRKRTPILSMAIIIAVIAYINYCKYVLFQPQSLARLYIVGMPGSGKSTLGRCLAKNIDWNFFDSDQLIEKKCGASISWIFELEGEEGFRTRESAQIESLSKENKAVIATGGGAILNADNRHLMKQSGGVIYLRASFEILLERVTRANSRPLLAQNAEENLRRLFQIRQPLYQEIADITIDTSPSAQARHLAEKLALQLSSYIGKA